MRISLVATPIWAPKTPPLTTSYLAGWLLAHGHEVFQLDWNIELFHYSPEPIREYWDRVHLHKWQDPALYATEIAPRIVTPGLDEYAGRILAGDPQMVGISAYSIEATLQLARRLRELRPDLVIVAGGQVCDPGLYGYALAWSGPIDVVVYGEGEGPLLDLVRTVEGGSRDFSHIRGLLIPHPGGAVEDTGHREPLPDIDAIPWPCFDGFPMDWYTPSVQPPYFPSRSVSTLLARGCVRKCDFCLQSEIWRGFRCRDARNVYEEMADRAHRFGATSLEFNDLLVNGSVRQIRQLCDLLIEKPLGLTWGGNAIVTRSLDLALLQKMKAAGCDFLGFGFESFSDPVLEAMGKHYRADEILRLLRDLRTAGIRFFSSLIIGHPREGRLEFADTIRFMIEHRSLFTEVPTSSLLIIQKNTPIWRSRDRWGIEMEDGDALGWRCREGGNDLAERKRRAQVMNFFYESLFGEGLRITDMDTARDLTLPSEAGG